MVGIWIDNILCIVDGLFVVVVVFVLMLFLENVLRYLCLYWMVVFGMVFEDW